MTGKTNFTNAVKELNQRKVDKVAVYSGVLGAFVNGLPVVPVANRPGMVYVRLRDNDAEIISAKNDVVSNIYGLPVLVIRDEVDVSTYRIKGRDVARYDDWSSNYIPEHSTSHTFGSGGDVTWVYSQQFMPLLAYPSGSAFGDSIVIDRYNYLYGTTWRQVGGTSLGGFTSLNPTGANDARAVLVYLQMDTGLFKIATGSMSEFNALSTGTATVLANLPTPPRVGVDIPIAGVRLVTGTTIISWANLYDVRPFFQPVPTGTSGGGTGGGSGYPTGAFTQGSIPYANSIGALTEDNNRLYWDNSSGTLLLGDRNPAISSSTAALIASAKLGISASIGLMLEPFGAGNFGYINIFHARGTKAAPTATQSGDSIFRIQARGHIGSGYASASRASEYFVANENWTSSNQGAQIEFYATETGTSTLNRIAHVKGDSLFVEKGLKMNMDILNYDDSEFTLIPKTAVIQRVLTGNALSTGSYNITLPSLEEAKNNLIIVHRSERDEGDEPTVPIILNTFQLGENFADDDLPYRVMASFETLFIYSDGFKWYDLTRGASKVRSQERIYRAGFLTIDTGQFHLFNRMNRQLRIHEVHGVCDGAPTGDDVIVDVLIDGNSIFASSADMLHIIDGNVTGVTSTFSNNLWDINQELRTDVVNIGSGSPGDNLVVTIVFD